MPATKYTQKRYNNMTRDLVTRQWSPTFLAPFSNDEFRTPLMSLFDSIAADMFKSMDPFKSVATDIKTRAYPKVDVRGVDKNLVFEAVVPFVKKEDLNVQIKDGTLIISGTVKKDESIEEGSFVKRELVRSSFSRSFPLNEALHAGWVEAGAEVKADLKDGVLKVELVNFFTEPEDKTVIRQIPIA